MCGGQAIAADALNLKCSVGADEVWLAIDASSGYMAVDGTRQELSVTNDYYSSKSKPVAGFMTIYRVSRKDGEMVISNLSGSQLTSQRKGTCEQATPPARKF